MGLKMANVVIVSGRRQVRGMTIRTWSLVGHVLCVVGWGKVAGFDNRCRVNRGERVSSEDDVFFIDVL